jgi:hypothetical protein
MSATPLIRTPQADGGTFYTFSSGARDLTRTLNNHNLDFVYSKFVLLNIPDFNRIDPNSFSNYQNFMQFDTIDGMINGGGLKADPNINFTESLQNYMLNLEEMIISDVNYDHNVRKTPAERIFFKWLKETGAIRFREATSLEKTSTITRPLFVEEDDNPNGTVQYRRVVKYLGDIDLVNNVDKSGEVYSEVYINIPTEVGGTPTIIFDSLQDNNYQPGLSIKGTSEFLNGRNAATIQPVGLSIKAFYDYDTPLLGGGPAGYTDPTANWMNESTPPNIVNSYFTEPSIFTDATNDDIRKYPADYGNPAGFTGVAYRRSRLDGISIDFTPTDYQQIVMHPAISTIAQYNGDATASTFEFNAVLVYYDLIDLSDSTKTVTNLYGILLLDNVTPTIDGGYVQRYPKFKPNPVTGQNGNSYGFKLNLRVDAAPGTSGVNTIINDYNTFSMGLFSEATAQLQESVKIFQTQQLEIYDMQLKIIGIENLVQTLPSVANLQTQITNIETQLQNASLAFSTPSTLLDLISANSDEIQAIVNGQTSLSLQYNSDVLRQGPGIILNKSVPNQVRIDLNAQQYIFMTPLDTTGSQIDVNNPLNLNVASPQFVVGLLPFTNMVRLQTVNTAGGDLLMFIDDSTIQWKTGQVVRIVFDSVLSLGIQNLRIYTDASNRLGTGTFGINAAIINGGELSTKPIIELICTQEGILTFVYDIVK